METDEDDEEEEEDDDEEEEEDDDVDDEDVSIPFSLHTCLLHPPRTLNRALIAPQPHLNKL